MKTRVLLLALLLVVGVTANPSFAENKDMIALQTQMNQLLKLQQSIDEKMGVLQDKINTLTQQVGQNLTKVNTTVDNLNKVMAQQQQVSDSCVDQVTGQAQPLQDALTELKANLAAIQKQLNELNSAHPQAAPVPQTPGTANPQ